MADGGDGVEHGLDHVFLGLRAGEGGSHKVGESVAVKNNDLRCTAQDIKVHMRAWVLRTWRGGEGLKLLGELLTCNTQ